MPNISEIVPVLHLVATLAMAGVILFVQVVHYPLLALVGREGYGDYQAGHTARTGRVVIPLMLTELASAVWLVASPTTGDARAVAWIGLALLGVIWGSTAIFQVRAHRRLAGGYDEKVHAQLVRTNWIRTVAWLARVPVALVLAG